jgi:hypothetical protein
MAILIFFKNYSFKIKKYYILLLCILIFINYFQIIIKESYSINEENNFINKYLTLKNLNDSLFFIKEKKSILSFFSKYAGRNITSEHTIFLATNCNFGNCIVILNKILFYCEIIGCKTIILDETIYWYIKKRIFYGKNNISIEVGEKKKLENSSSSLYYNSPSIYYNFFYIKPEIRISLIRNEIIKNLNKVNVDKEDLYIHIRSGDIFIFAHSPYSQPPFCFYKTILNNYKFNKVYLIAQDKNNPIIEKILSEYTNIIYKQNDIKEDISYLINAYNVVASISSFIISIIQLNYNLEKLFDYNIYKMTEKIYHYHYDLYQFPHNNFINYRMEPSPHYNQTMFNWKNNKKQRKLMIIEKCINNFTKINKSNKIF